MAGKGGPLGTYLGGTTLGSGNIEGPVHNYKTVFTVSSISAAVAFFWLLIVINENTNKADINSNIKKGQNDNRSESNERPEKDDQNENQTKEKPKSMDRKFKISRMFDIKNLKDLITTSIKVRPNRGRPKIWLLYLSTCVLILTDVRNFSILFPYIEKMFDYNAQQFSQIKSISSIAQILTMAIMTSIFSYRLKLLDTHLAIIGLVSTFLSDIILGTFINLYGFYTMYGISTVSAVGTIAIRSLITKIASESETGKVLGLLGAMETIFPSI